MTNYRDGFERLFAVLTLIWIGGVLFFAPPDRVKFWHVDQVMQVQELTFPAWPPHVRVRQFLWIAALIALPPVVAFIITFHSVPWIYRGFR